MEKLEHLLVDTDILIDVGRGIDNAVDYIDSCSKKYHLSISIVTEMELIVGCRNKTD